MNSSSPFSKLSDALSDLGSRVKLPQPPAWLIDEMQQRVVLFLNHVLMQESEAQKRLQRQKGRTVRVQWRSITLQLAITPAGLVERVAEPAVDALGEGAQQIEPDLRLTVTDESPLALAKAAARGDKPAVRIEGDVQLAAEINWLVDNLRWDVEEDLSRLIGDAPAHALGKAGRAVAQALRRFVGAATGGGDKGAA